MSEKFRVLVSDKLSENGLDILRACPKIEVEVKTGMTPEELIETIPDYDGIIIRSGTKVTADVVKAAKKLKVVGRAGAGVDNVDVLAASKAGIAVENTPGGNTVTTAEHTFALLVSLARNIPQGTAGVKAGEWNRKLLGIELKGKTLGLIGLGRVGSVVVRCAQGLLMNCIAYDPFISMEHAEELGVEVVDMDEIFSRSDFITIHSPLTEKTRHMISDEQFAKMKDGVRIVNCARGGIIDEASLLRALESGKVGGAALDVFEKEPPPEGYPLTAHPKVICTPHLGASTGEAQENVAIAVANQMAAYAETGVIVNAVNVPAVDPELLKQIQPYLTLAEKTGSMLAQIIEGGVKEIEIAASGEIADVDMKPLATSVLKGFLSVIIGDDVNFVNAPLLAEERGIIVKTSSSQTAHNFTGLLTVKVLTDTEEHTVSGTIFGKTEPRIVNINGVYIEAVPEGNIIFFTNRDKPGVIGAIGTYLAERNINIAQFRLGRTAALDRAVCLVNIDSSLAPEMLEGIQKLKHVEKAWMINL